MVMARPKKKRGESRDRLMQVRVQSKEYESFKDAADQTGMDLSEWVRARLRDAMLRDKKRYLPLTGEDSK
jgi:hypothetical protein